MAGSFDAYDKARKMGLACYKERTSLNQDPYLPVLDQILSSFKVQKERPLGVKEVLLDLVVGTKTEGRTNAFAANFMPLLEKDTEFADKWMSLYNSQLEEGIREPIKAYEVAGQYYVQEGNKRVSVLKYCQSPSIMAEIREIIVEPEDNFQGRLYKEYLKFKDITGIHSIIMTQLKNYTRLLKIVKAPAEGVMPADQADELRSQFKSFYYIFNKMGGGHLTLSAGDAFLLYLDVYGYHPGSVMVQSVLTKELEKIWDEFKVYPQKKEVRLTTTTEGTEKKSLISSIVPKGPLKVAFIDAKTPVSSSWTKEQEEARMNLQKEMHSEIQAAVFNDANTPEQIKAALNKAIEDGYEVIFTTSPSMLQISNQYAAKFPRLKILNCSLNMDTSQLRTYFSRDYEVQFLMGILAGILSATNNIGYIASYPIYGIVANINAFAIGVQMTNPRAKVYLDWSTTLQSTLTDYPLNTDILYIDGEKFNDDFVEDRKYGLFDVGNGKFFNLAQETIHWDVFYKKILKSILNNSWKSDHQRLETESINYWWGLSNGLLEISFSHELPYQTRRLVSMLKDNIAMEQFKIFSGDLTTAEGEIIHAQAGLPLDQIATMDWLNSNIIGTIPKESQFKSDADNIVSKYGIDKVKEEPEE